MTSYLVYISKQTHLWRGLLVLGGIVACVTAPPEKKKSNLSRPIAPPAEMSEGKSVSEAQKLLNQLPEDARDSASEVSLPADYFGPNTGPVQSPEEKRRAEFRARRTDAELMGNTKNSMTERNAKQMGNLNKKFGVTNTDLSGEAPSYILALQKIKNLYKERKLEEALIEVNENLRYYPESANLLLMKGTLHQKLGQIDMALAAYLRAYDYEPSKRLRVQINYLRKVIAERENLRAYRKGNVQLGGVQEMVTLPTPKPVKEAKGKLFDPVPANPDGILGKVELKEPLDTQQVPENFNPFDEKAMQEEIGTGQLGETVQASPTPEVVKTTSKAQPEQIKESEKESEKASVEAPSEEGKSPKKEQPPIENADIVGPDPLMRTQNTVKAEEKEKAKANPLNEGEKK